MRQFKQSDPTQYSGDYTHYRPWFKGTKKGVPLKPESALRGTVDSVRSIKDGYGDPCKVVNVTTPEGEKLCVYANYKDLEKACAAKPGDNVLVTFEGDKDFRVEINGARDPEFTYPEEVA